MQWRHYLTVGDIDTDSSGYCDGICIWRRALWADMQCRTVQWGWGTVQHIYFISNSASNLFLMYLCCRHASSSNNLYQESVTVMQWYVNQVIHLYSQSFNAWYIQLDFKVDMFFCFSWSKCAIGTWSWRTHC